MHRSEFTRWTLIRRAQGEGPEARAALGELLARYERTILGQIRALQARLNWRPPALGPEDLKQALLEELLRRRDVRRLDPARGRFRGWLRVTVDHFVRRKHRQWLAAKRGNTITGAVEFEVVEWTTPELEYTRAFVADLLAAVMARLDAANDRNPRYRALRRFLPGPQMDPVELKPLAETLGITSNTLAVSIHALRAQYRKLLYEAVADTLDLDADRGGTPSAPAQAVASASVKQELYELYHALVDVDRTDVRLHVERSE